MKKRKKKCWACDDPDNDWTTACAECETRYDMVPLGLFGEMLAAFKKFHVDFCLGFCTAHRGPKGHHKECNEAKAAIVRAESDK